MNESKSPEMLNAFRWEVLCNRIERASQADFDFIVCALQQSRKTSSEALAWAVDTLIANSHELDAPVGPVSDIRQIAKEMRDAAGDFESWGRDVINAFADRLDATAAPTINPREIDSRLIDTAAPVVVGEVTDEMICRFANVYYGRGKTYGPDRIRAALSAALAGEG